MTETFGLYIVVQHRSGVVTGFAREKADVDSIVDLRNQIVDRGVGKLELTEHIEDDNGKSALLHIVPEAVTAQALITMEIIDTWWLPSTDQAGTASRRKETYMRYLENAAVMAMLEVAPSFQKKDVTLLRLPTAAELGSTLVTYVKDGDSVRVEAEAVLTADVVIARNHALLADGVYNEWAIPVATVVKNYGQPVLDSLTEAFAPFKKKALVKAIALDDELMSMLNIDGDILEIDVSWSDKPMQAKVGDYLTSGGYSISANDMKGYEQVA